MAVDIKQAIELTVPAGRTNLHVITRRRPRLTDGIKHPVIIIKHGKKGGMPSETNQA